MGLPIKLHCVGFSYPKARGQGLGKTLLDAAISFCRDQFKVSMSLDNWRTNDSCPSLPPGWTHTH